MDEAIVDTNQEVQEEIIKEDPEDLTTLNQIQNRYAFWYRYDSGKGSTNYTNYNQSIKKIASFQSVERFWTIYDYLKRPSDFKDIKAVEFHLFKDGISPFWEDSQNKAGGKWMLRLRKGVAARYWEDILLAIIGEQFDVGAEICGAVLSIRGNEDIISVWNKTAENTEAVNKIRDQIRRIVRLPDIIPLEYKVHMDSVNDKSSYRNPNMVFRATTKPGDRYGGAYRDRQQTGEQGSGYHHRTGPSGGGWKGSNSNSNSRWSGGNNDEGTGGEQRRERTDGGHHRDRGEHDQQGGWRRTRSDGDGGESNNNNNRERGEYRSNFRDRSTNNVSSSSSGQTASSKPPTQSSTYASGGGSFASRLKGTSDAASVPASEEEGSLKSPTGESWTKVKNPFSKA
jgi:translation initiation factor 4E